MSLLEPIDGSEVAHQIGLIPALEVSPLRGTAITTKHEPFSEWSGDLLRVLLAHWTEVSHDLLLHDWVVFLYLGDDKRNFVLTVGLHLAVVADPNHKECPFGTEPEINNSHRLFAFLAFLH